MFALVFRFPAGRYHATPWGRHVNEGAVAWPPEPYRLLRALIATWYRKVDRAHWDVAALHRLIEALAETLPVYRLPAAVHAHTRHYMPMGTLDQGREKTGLVFDAFFRLDPGDELVAAWPGLTLPASAYALAGHLAGLMGYLGRAESNVLARATDAAAGDFPVRPAAATGEVADGWATTDVLVPLSAAEYALVRPGLLALGGGRLKPKARALHEATVPATLTDALQVETAELQAAGWSRPPAGRFVVYARPEVGPRPPVRARLHAATARTPTVARLVLAGRPRPPITDAVRIGEVFRQALMARIDAPVPSVLSGRTADGAPLRDPRHGHAFFLPEDADGDGWIDHVVLYARDGLDRAVRQAVEHLGKLWVGDARPRDADQHSSPIAICCALPPSGPASRPISAHGTRKPATLRPRPATWCAANVASAGCPSGRFTSMARPCVPAGRSRSPGADATCCSSAGSAVGVA
jgi:CRISPR-associated protein Csb2